MISKLNIVAWIIFVLTFIPNIVLVFEGITSLPLYANLTSYLLVVPLFVPLMSKFSLFKIPKSVLFIYLYITLFLLSNYYTISDVASKQKTLSTVYSIISPCFLLMLAFMLIKERRICINKYVHMGIRYSSIIIFLLFFLYLLGFRDSAEDEGRTFVKGMIDPIWSSRYIGFLILFQLYNLMNRLKKVTVIDILSFPCALFLLVQSGSRGPLIAVGIIVLYVLCPRLSIKKNILLFACLLLVFFLFMSYSSRMQSDASDYSNQARIMLISKIFDSDFDYWRGVGIGSYNLLILGIDELYYPHNIFLETFVETGILGLTLILILVFYLFRNRQLNLVFIICIYYFINAQLSGDINGNNMFFIFGELCLLQILLNEKNDECCILYNK